MCRCNWPSAFGLDLADDHIMLKSSLIANVSAFLLFGHRLVDVTDVMASVAFLVEPTSTFQLRCDLDDLRPTTSSPARPVYLPLTGRTDALVHALDPTARSSPAD